MLNLISLFFQNIEIQTIDFLSLVEMTRKMAIILTKIKCLTLLFHKGGVDFFKIDGNWGGSENFC